MARMTFTGTAPFEASNKAVTWCEKRGLSVGPSDRYHKRGILLGNFLIAKWHKLTAREIAELDGVMYDEGREGPVYIELKDEIMTKVIDVPEE